MFARVFNQRPVLLLNEKAQPKQVCLGAHQDVLDKCDAQFAKVIKEEIEEGLLQNQQASGQTWPDRKYKAEFAKANNSPEAAQRLEELRAESAEYQAASAGAKNSKFNVYLKKDSIEGTKVHQDMRYHAAILIAVGVVLVSVVASLILTHVITVGATTMIALTVAALFLIVFGTGTILASRYMKRGKEVVAVKYGELKKIYQPVRGVEKGFSRIQDDTTCYIPQSAYKSFQRALYLADKK